ncbi:hypothetical protein E2C01_056875 [Portunus trituberculatus]|uniref:Uncharacterized protein n=1 Tax=Portunus trituberculatus TaxID=210409 RepID=A0A5B7GZE3_PORTR|nr:hypothetical protein [Portunus trituberculatus]
MQGLLCPVCLCNYGCVSWDITLLYLAPPLLGTVDKLECIKITAHKRLTTLFITEELLDDLVLDSVDILHKRNEVSSRQVDRGKLKRSPVRNL